MARWRSNAAVVAGALAVAVSAGLAGGARGQDDGAATEPFADLEVRYGLAPDQVLEILSSRSLMLSRDDAARIEEAKLVAQEFAANRNSLAGLSDLDVPLYTRTTPEGEVIAAAPLPDLRLDAILYMSTESWTVWINGEAITPAALPEGYAIGAIGPRSVEIAWQPDGAEGSVVLKPGQVYVAATGEILEADEVAAAAPADAAATPDAVADDQAVSGEGSSAGPKDLVLSADQIEDLRQLQQALSAASGNAASLGLSEDELQALQASLAAGGGAGTLTAEQQEQLLRVQQATGTTQ